MSGRDRDFDSFISARLPSLLRFGYLLCGHAGRAQVLVENAVVAALRHRVGPDAADDYVQRHVLRTLLRGTRPGWRGRPTGSPSAPPVPTAGPLHGADDPQVGTGSDAHDLVWEGLGTLPVRERAMLVLRYAEDRSDVDIAELTGLRPAAVRASLAAGLSALPQLAETPEWRPFDRVAAAAAPRPPDPLPEPTADFRRPGHSGPEREPAPALSAYLPPRETASYRRPAPVVAAHQRPRQEVSAFRRPVAAPVQQPRAVEAVRRAVPTAREDVAGEARPAPEADEVSRETRRRGEQLWGRPR